MSLSVKVDYGEKTVQGKTGEWTFASLNYVLSIPQTHVDTGEERNAIFYQRTESVDIEFTFDPDNSEGWLPALGEATIHTTTQSAKSEQKTRGQALFSYLSGKI